MTDPAEPATPRSRRASRPAPGRPARAGSRAIAPASERPPLDIARRIVELAEDKKAADIVLLDLTGLTTLADALRHLLGRVGAAARRDRRRDRRGRCATRRSGRSGARGRPSSHWVLLDFGAVVVHIFTPPEREYYSLEKHWSEARTVLRVQ